MINASLELRVLWSMDRELPLEDVFLLARRNGTSTGTDSAEERRERPKEKNPCETTQGRNGGAQREAAEVCSHVLRTHTE